MASEMELVITSGVQLVSTVLGVYLAARAAHRNTVEYERPFNPEPQQHLQAAAKNTSLGVL
jgi:hypothetical protein